MRQQGGAYTNDPDDCCEAKWRSINRASARFGGLDYLYDDQIQGGVLCIVTNLVKYWESLKVACTSGRLIVYAGYLVEEFPNRGWELRAAAALPEAFSLGVWYDLGPPQLLPVGTGDSTQATCRPSPGNLPRIELMVTDPGTLPP